MCANPRCSLIVLVIEFCNIWHCAGFAEPHCAFLILGEKKSVYGPYKFIYSTNRYNVYRWQKCVLRCSLASSGVWEWLAHTTFAAWSCVKPPRNDLNQLQRVTNISNEKNIEFWVKVNIELGFFHSVTGEYERKPTLMTARSAILLKPKPRHIICWCVPPLMSLSARCPWYSYIIYV